eukprot:symbB.v1.2.032055.t1/scaffold3795.1/size50223/3
MVSKPEVSDLFGIAHFYDLVVVKDVKELVEVLRHDLLEAKLQARLKIAHEGVNGWITGPLGWVAGVPFLRPPISRSLLAAGQNFLEESKCGKVQVFANSWIMQMNTRRFRSMRVLHISVLRSGMKNCKMEKTLCSSM